MKINYQPAIASYHKKKHIHSHTYVTGWQGWRNQFWIRRNQTKYPLPLSAADMCHMRGMKNGLCWMAYEKGPYIITRSLSPTDKKEKERKWEKFIFFFNASFNLLPSFKSTVFFPHSLTNHRDIHKLAHLLPSEQRSNTLFLHLSPLTPPWNNIPPPSYNLHALYTPHNHLQQNLLNLHWPPNSPQLSSWTPRFSCSPPILFSDENSLPP